MSIISGSSSFNPPGGVGPATPNSYPSAPTTGNLEATAENWIALVRSVRMEFDGITASPLPADIAKQFPGLRVNYIEIPWGMSLPSRGCVLVSSAQLIEIEKNPNAEKMLTLTAYGETDLQVFSPVQIRGLFIDRAVPLYGRHMGEYISDPASSQFADTPITFDGLWALYFTDDRAERMFYPHIAHYNVRDPSQARYYNVSGQDNPKFMEGMENSDEPEKILHSWRSILRDIESTVWPEDDGNILRYKDVTPPENLTPQNLSFRGVPAPTALDIVLHQVGYVVVPNLTKITTDAARYRFRTWGRREDIIALHGAIAAVLNVRMAGGTHRRYARPNVPTDTGVIFRPSRGNNWAGDRDPTSDMVFPHIAAATTSEYTSPVIYSVPIQGTAQLIPLAGSYVDADVASAGDIAADIQDVVSQKYRLPPGNMAFHGWWPQFMDFSGWSLLTFSLDDGRTARTSIEIAGIGSPMGIVQRSIHNAKLKGEPVPVAISSDGGISWMMSQEGAVHIQQQPLWFVGKVTQRDLSDNTLGGYNRGIIEPLAPMEDEQDWYQEDSDSTIPSAATTGEEVPAYLGHNTWIEEGDIVLCFYTGLADPLFMAVGLPPVRVAGGYCPPPDDCACDDVVTSCSDCETDPLLIDDQKDLLTDDDVEDPDG